LISEDVFSDQDAIQTALHEMPKDKRDYALLQIQDIENAVRQYLEKMSAEQSDIKKQMDNTTKSEKACLSYGSSIDIQHKGKE
jgi:hypothetical protein